MCLSAVHMTSLKSRQIFIWFMEMIQLGTGNSQLDLENALTKFMVFSCCCHEQSNDCWRDIRVILLWFWRACGVVMKSENWSHLLYEFCWNSMQILRLRLHLIGFTTVRFGSESQNHDHFLCNPLVPLFFFICLSLSFLNLFIFVFILSSHSLPCSIRIFCDTVIRPIIAAALRK